MASPVGCQPAFEPGCEAPVTAMSLSPVPLQDRINMLPPELSYRISGFLLGTCQAGGCDSVLPAPSCFGYCSAHRCPYQHEYSQSQCHKLRGYHDHCTRRAHNDFYVTEGYTYFKVRFECGGIFKRMYPKLTDGVWSKMRTVCTDCKQEKGSADDEITKDERVYNLRYYRGEFDDGAHWDDEIELDQIRYASHVYDSDPCDSDDDPW